jgi:ADP-ribose pyrophosphatase YjhB (NUDIX family)
VLEETGLAVEPGELLGWVERLDGGHHFVILDFLAPLEEGDDSLPVAGDDAEEARFVPLSEVRSLPLAAGLGRFLAEHGLC